MEKSLSHKKDRKLLIASIIAAVIIFHISYGLNTLIPTNISWMMTPLQDWGAHYLGFYFYQTEPWHFPLGDIHNYYYPIGTNVGFTDSIPLFAIFFKIFSFILPEDFQYFGIWLLLCHVLTAYYTVKLSRLFHLNNFYSFIAVLFMVSNPVLIYRGIHPALCCHWIFLAAIYLYFLPSASPKRILRYQFLLLLIAALVNPYIFLMMMGFTIIIAYKLCFIDKKISAKTFFGYELLSITTVIAVWLTIGLISFDGKNLDVTGAYGLYSLNLNSLYNPDVFSSFLPKFKQVSWHQYEGFMYLGIGMMLIIFLVFFFGISNLIAQKSRVRMRRLLSINSTNTIPLFVLCAIFTLFSVTHVVSINDKILFRLPLPASVVKLGEVFRASARFFWIPYYLIVFFSIVAFSRIRIQKSVGWSIMIIAIAIQLYDIKLLMSHRSMSYGSYHTPLDDEKWLNLMSQFDEVVFFPPFESHQRTQMDYQFFCYLAAKARKPINIGYVARVNNKLMKTYTDSLTKTLENGKISPKALYISTYPELDHFSVALQNGSSQLNALNGYYYIFSRSAVNNKLSDLTKKLNLENKSTLDSGIQKSSTRIYFREVSHIDPTDKKAITYYITRFNKEENYIAAEGWAFIDSTHNNKGDSIFLSLSSDEHSYITPAKIKARPDITSHFKKPYLGDAGFEVLSFFDNVSKGKYRAGIAIKNINGEFVFQPAENIVNLGIPDYAIADKTDHLPEPGPISFGMDYVKADSAFVEVSGWAAYQKQDVGFSKIFFFLKNDRNIYITATDQKKRPDVTAAFKNKLKLDDSGFMVKFSRKSLEKGKYKLGILISDPVNKKENIVYIDKELDL